MMITQEPKACDECGMIGEGEHFQGCPYATEPPKGAEGQAAGGSPPPSGARGTLNADVNLRAMAFRGHGIGPTELRLYPYLVYCLHNDRKIDPAKVSQDEREILKELKNDGHLDGGASGLQVTKAFYTYMCEQLWWAYVNYDGKVGM